jgi:hypothetical protein
MKVKDTELAGRGPSVLADTIGRWLLILASVSTVGAFILGITLIKDAPDSRIWIEFWRTSAFLVFAGLFAILAVAPRTQRGLWELVIAQKWALVIFSLVVGDVNEVRESALIDLILVVAVTVAYILRRGWYAWRTTTPEPAALRPSAAPVA